MLNRRVVHWLHSQVKTVFRIFVPSMSKTFHSPPRELVSSMKNSTLVFSLGNRPWGSGSLLFWHPLRPLSLTYSRKLIYKNPKHRFSGISGINSAWHQARFPISIWWQLFNPACIIGCLCGLVYQPVGHINKENKRETAMLSCSLKNCIVLYVVLSYDALCSRI